MYPRLSVLLSKETNPFINLTLENQILTNSNSNIITLFLWRNIDTIIIGRHQNPWTECNVQKTRLNNIHLARRQSGGGTVFHDKGNTNFTFFADKSIYHKEQNFKILTSALQKLGIPAKVSPRNNILVNEKKVSGSAFKHTRKHNFHHGTLLISSDLQKLNEYLQPSADNITSKGTKSVVSQVTNLSNIIPSINHSTACDALIESFSKHYNIPYTIQSLDKNNITTDSYDYYTMICSWDWIFGKTPDFSRTFTVSLPHETINITLEIKGGLIHSIHIQASTLTKKAISLIQKIFTGRRYEKVPADTIKKFYNHEKIQHIFDRINFSL